MTLHEYLEDYASEETRQHAPKLIAQELKYIPSERIRQRTLANIEEIKKGQRDFRF